MDVESGMAEFKRRGADIIHGPVDRELYGVRDPDGHHFVVAEDLHPE